MDFTNYEQKVFSQMVYFLYGNGGTVTTVKFTVEMIDAVDGEILRHAAQKAADRFPYLSLKLELREDGLYMVHNSLPLPVLHTASPVKLCAEETNYHLHAVTYDQNKICFPALHALYDGLGGTRFRQTLLYYYCQEKYDSSLKAPEGCFLLGDEIDEEEYKNPYLTEKVKSRAAAVTPDRLSGGWYDISSDNSLTDTACISHLIKINEEDLLRFCKENNTPVFAMSAILYAKAVSRYKSVPHKPILLMFPANLRNALGTPKAICPAVDFCYLLITDEMLAMPLPQLGAMIKAAVKKCTGEEALVMKAAGQAAQAAMMTKVPLKTLLTAGNKLESINGMLAISYMGQLKWGDMLRYINGGYSIGNFPYRITCQENSMGGIFTMAFIQTFTEDKYARALCAELDENGIGYEYESHPEEAFPQAVLPL